MTDDQKYWIWFAASLAVALLGSVAPVRQMPLDYKAMLWKSIPLAISWGLILGFCVWNYKERGLWLVVGAPLALYWPIWLMFHGLPSCYYSGNCI
jgi:hypothetical protein